MKRIGRFFAAMLLVCASLLCLFSCKETDSEVPEGFLTATCYGADYRLYVPSTWVVNNTYGVSAAYRNSVEQSTVSVHKYEITAETETALAGKDRLSAYWEEVLLPAIREQALGGEVIRVEEDCIPTVFGGLNAIKRHVTANLGGQTLHCLQVVAERNGSFYAFTYLANEAYYNITRSEADGMIAQFVFSDEPYQPEDYAWQLEEDANVPDGMQVAYSKDVPYRFYAPSGWVVDLDRRISSAWDPTDKTNVSVLPYSPDESMGVKEYFEKEIAALEENRGVTNVTRLSETETTISGRKAMQYDFSCGIDGTVLRYRQIIVVYKSRIYCVTYTATESAFGNHLGELEAIVNAFAFR